MNEPKFKEGDCVKKVSGTQEMTIVCNNIGDKQFTGEVKCRYKNSVGEEVETNFWETDLELI